jgi:hypothetical protein
VCAPGGCQVLLADPLPSGTAEGFVTILDRTFGWLLVVGALLHAAGSWHAFHNHPPQLLWALSGSLAALLVAALNLLRVGRPTDRPLAWVSFVASLAWLAVAVGFGAVMGHLADPRAVIHGVNAAVLAGLSLRTLMRAPRDGAA